MNIPDNLKKAIGSFKWADVQTHFEGFPPDKLHAEIELVLDVILRDGYLILRRPDPARATRRTSFMADFRHFAAVHGADGLFGAELLSTLIPTITDAQPDAWQVHPTASRPQPSLEVVENVSTLDNPRSDDQEKQPECVTSKRLDKVVLSFRMIYGLVLYSDASSTATNVPIPPTR